MVRGSVDDVFIFSKKYLGSDFFLVVENELKLMMFKNYWMIVIIFLDWMLRGEIKIIIDYGKFDDGSFEKMWIFGEFMVFCICVSILWIGFVVVVVVIGVFIVVVVVLVYFKCDVIWVWCKKCVEVVC